MKKAMNNNSMLSVCYMLVQKTPSSDVSVDKRHPRFFVRLLRKEVQLMHGLLQ